MLHHLDHAAVAARLPAGVDEADWLLLRGNIAHLRELAAWLPVLDGVVTPPALDPAERAFLAQAAQIAARLDWAAAPWSTLSSELKTVSGRKGKPLFLPLRLALTGRESGPEMAPLLERIGQATAVERLRAAAAERHKYP